MKVKGTAIVAALLFALCARPALARRRAHHRAPERASTVSLHLKDLDLVTRLAHIEVSGLGHSPKPNFFTFTDDRDRHFVAMTVTCEPPAAGRQSCEIELPKGYEQHRLVSVALHLRGLHGPAVEVPRAEVRAAWEEASAAVEPVVHLAPAINGSREDGRPGTF